MFKLGVERSPLDAEQDLASAPTFSRLEHQIDRKDLYRLTRALVDHFIASYPEPPPAVVLDLDHSDDPTHGQQEFTFYNHYHQYLCHLRKAEGGLRGMNTTQAGDLVENLA